MFERDLPGENKSGLSFQEASDKLPVETCETINGSWGFNITDRNYKSSKALIHYLVNAAGRNTNFLLNIGPRPDGTVQPQFVDTLKLVGNWMQQYGETIYGTRGNIIPPQEWGVVTGKDKSLFVHVLSPKNPTYIFIPEVEGKVTNCSLFSTKKAVKFKQQDEGVFIYLNGLDLDAVDTVFELKM